MTGGGIFLNRRGCGEHLKKGGVLGLDASGAWEVSLTVGTFGGEAFDVSGAGGPVGAGVSVNYTSFTITGQYGPGATPFSARAGSTTITPHYGFECPQ